MTEVKGLLLTCETCNGYWYDSQNCEDCNKTGWQTLDGEKIVYVNVYSITRHYGGAEEGGWYYNWFDCKEVYPVKNKNADLIREELEKEYEKNKHGDIYSVLGGTDIAVYIEEYPKESETKERPYYE